MLSVAGVELGKSRDIQMRESCRRMPGQGWRAGAQSRGQTQVGSQQPACGHRSHD